MPKVVMLVSMAASNWSLVPGNVTDVNEEIADAWQEHGIAKLYVQEVVKVIEHNTEIPLPPEEPSDDIDQTEPTEPAGESVLANQEEEIKHLGGGWYELPDGFKVQGKEEALEALKEQQGSDE